MAGGETNVGWVSDIILITLLFCYCCCRLVKNNNNNKNKDRVSFDIQIQFKNWQFQSSTDTIIIELQPMPYTGPLALSADQCTLLIYRNRKLINFGKMHLTCLLFVYGFTSKQTLTASGVVWDHERPRTCVRQIGLLRLAKHA